jgi:integrase
MAVHKYERSDGSTVYFASYRGPDGKRITDEPKGRRTVKPDASAKEHARARLAVSNYASTRRTEVENGTWQPLESDRPKEKGLTVRALAKRFTAQYRSRNGSVTFYEQRLAAIDDELGALLASRVTVDDVERFKNRRSDKAGPATVKKDLVALSKVFRWAQHRGLVKDNPAEARRVPRPAEPRRKVVFLDDDQEAALLAAADLWLSRIVRWMLGTGMDRGEVVALRWENVDLTRGTVYAPRAKTGVARSIALTDTLRALLEECRKSDPSHGGEVVSLEARREGLVFLNAHGGPVTVAGLKTAFVKLYRRAGVTTGSPAKVLRHTFATRALEAGVHPSVLADLLGHTSAAIVDRYAHATDRLRREAMLALESRGLQKALQKAETAHAPRKGA